MEVVQIAQEGKISESLVPATPAKSEERKGAPA
jgi:hypothetical protein